MRKQLIKKVLTTSLAAAMVLSMGVPAFAADTEDVVSKHDSNYVIQKTLKTPANTTVTKPTESYTFTVAAGVADSSDSSKAGVTDGLTTTQTITADNLTGSTGGVYTGYTTADLFSGVNFTEEGIYNYTITETAGNTADMTYSNTSYAVKVKVVKDENDNYNITGVTANDGTSKKNAIEFTNTYQPWGNSDTPSGGGTPDTDKGLTISKSVEGTESNTNDTFTFSVTFTKDANVTNKITVSYDGTASNTTGEIEYGTYTFTLTGNDSINFKIPAGTQYNVTETGKGDYTSTKVSVNGADATTALTSGTQTITTGANTVAFTNSHDVGTLTGVFNQYSGLIMIVAIAAVGLVVISIRRRREA